MKKGIINAAEGIMKRSIEIKGDSQEIESEDLVIISLQNSLVEKAKDINYLLDKKRIQSINIILRSMLEQYVSLIYILKGKTKLKAKLYIYSFKIQRIEKLIDTMNFMENMNEYDISENDNIRKIILEKIQRDDPKLNSIEDYISKLKESYDDVQPYKPNKKDKFYYEKWYNINGKIRGMRNLMKEINIADADYEFFYSLASMDVHGISAFGNVKASKNELVLESSLDIKLLESLMTSYLISSAKAITNYYSVNNDSKIKGYMKQFEINFKYQSVNK